LKAYEVSKQFNTGEKLPLEKAGTRIDAPKKIQIIFQTKKINFKFHLLFLKNWNENIVIQCNFHFFSHSHKKRLQILRCDSK
jgi:hypothetical protein